MTLSYDSSVLQFVSCNTTYGGGGGSVMATGESYTVTLKAVSAGNSSLSVSANDGVIFDSNEEMDSMSGSSASVTVKKQQVQIQIQAIIVAVTVEPPTETEHQRVETGILRRILERQQENSLRIIL